MLLSTQGRVKLCSCDTRAVLKHTLDLGMQDLSSSVKFFPSLDLKEKYPKIWPWDNFCCCSAHLSQIFSHSYLRTLQTKEMWAQF